MNEAGSTSFLDVIWRNKILIHIRVIALSDFATWTVRVVALEQVFSVAQGLYGYHLRYR